MLKEYFKQVFKKPTEVETAAAAAQQEEVNMSVQTEQAAAPAENTAELQATQVADASAALTAQLETVSAEMATLQAQLADMTAKYETAQAALDATEAAKAELAQQAAEKELAERKEAIVKAVGTDKADGVLAALADMPREQFNTIVSAMAASVDAEAKSPMFTEQGAAAEAPVAEQKLHFNQFIKK